MNIMADRRQALNAMLVAELAYRDAAAPDAWEMANIRVYGDVAPCWADAAAGADRIIGQRWRDAEFAARNDRLAKIVSAFDACDGSVLGQLSALAGA